MEFETVCLKVRNLGRLYCYFKVKFRNHIEAIIRKQESQNVNLIVSSMKIFIV